MLRPGFIVCEANGHVSTACNIMGTPPPTPLPEASGMPLEVVTGTHERLSKLGERLVEVMNRPCLIETRKEGGNGSRVQKQRVDWSPQPWRTIDPPGHQSTCWSRTFFPFFASFFGLTK